MPSELEQRAYRNGWNDGHNKGWDDVIDALIASFHPRDIRLGGYAAMLTPDDICAMFKKHVEKYKRA